MKARIAKILSSRFVRGIRIYALAYVAASLVSISATDVLMNDANAGMCAGGGSTDGMPCTSSGECGPGGTCAPEIPLAMLPVFLLISAGSFYVIRRRYSNAVA